MSNRPRPRAYFFRNGVELCGFPLHGRTIESLGVPTGSIGNALCFHSITVRDTVDNELTEADFDGPVSVKIWSPDHRERWVGLASVDTVNQVNREQRERLVR